MLWGYAMMLAMFMRKSIITMRTTDKEKEDLQRAASLAGFSNLTNFMMTAARKEANRILSDLHTTYVSPQDWQMITEALESPPEPNAALINLLRADDE